MLCYGSGDFAAVLYWTMATRFLPMFYTDVFGISAGALGTMLLFSRIWDGINDPLVGVWADRNQSRWGRFRPFILFGSVPYALAAVFCFTTPDIGDLGKLLWAYAGYNLFMMVCTVVNIPYTSLMGVMTNDSTERTRLSSIKFICAYSAAFVVSAGLLPAAEKFGKANPQLGWQLVAIAIGIAGTIFYLITFLGTRERVQPVSAEKSSVLRDLELLIKNRAWLIILGTTLTWVLSGNLKDSVSLHYLKYEVFGGNPDMALPFLWWEFSFTCFSSTFFGVSTAVGISGILLIAAVASKVPKKALFIVLFAGSAVCNLGFWFLKPGDIGLLVLLQIGSTLFGAPTPVLLWAMFADTADYGEWKTGRRTTGLVFSASSFSMKMGTAIAGAAAFALLDLAGFVANEAPSESVRASLRNMMSIYPLLLAMLSIAIFAFYPLTEKRMKQIKVDLNLRRKAS